MKYKTRGNASPQGKPRVYFTGHPQDCARYFGPLSDLILQPQNCAVFYDPDPEHPEDAENFLSDLDTMQLIVLVVTSRYVYQSTFAHDTVFAHAVEHYIPVLPVLEEGGIEEDFNKKCGDIQFLDATARDDTQLPFEAKLKKYLDAVLVGDQLAQQVRDAFDAYIFLSYRKKDRRFAQQLMRLIHENDFCRDIAIWYDEFLVPGENFNAAIRQALEKSALFALAVTPSLLETPNYAMTEEYPNAKTAGKKILPVRLVKTNKKKLRRCYKALPPLLDAGNAPRLAAVLRDALAGAADPDRSNDPRHLYLIGLAYLGGIDVEVDYPRAVELITRAAEADLPEAIEKLVSMYNTGEGVARDYGTAVEWQRRLVAVRQKEYKDRPNMKRTQLLLSAFYDLGFALMDLRCLPEASETFRALLETFRVRSSDGDIPGYGQYISGSYAGLGDIGRLEGNLSAASVWYEKGLAVAELLAQETGTVEAIQVLVLIYNRLGDLSSVAGDLAAARAWYEKQFAASERLVQETGTVEARKLLSASYGMLGDICRREGDIPAAGAWYEKMLTASEQLARETETVESRQNLGAVYNRLGDLCYAEDDLPAAKAWYEKLLAIMEPLAKETGAIDIREGLCASYDRLGSICHNAGDLPAARAWYEKMLAMTEQLIGETGTVKARQNLSISYSKLGDVCCDEGDLPAARAWYEKGLTIAERLVRETGTIEARQDLSVNYDRMAYSCYDEGDLSGARAWCEKLLAIAKQLAKETGTIQARHELIVGYNISGNICYDEGDLPAARAWCEKGLAIWEMLARETGTVEARRILSFNYGRMGDICRDAGEQAAAQAWYEKDLAITERLCRQADQADRANVQDDLANLCCCLALCALPRAQKTVYLQRAETIWAELSEQHPEDPRYAENLAVVRHVLST